MIGNVQIIKNSGESLIVNGLARFMVNETSRQYIAYSLGEQTENVLKIYIGLENVSANEVGISKEESDSLTNILKSIGKDEDVSSILTFLPLSADIYYIHDEVKKIGVPAKIVNNMTSLQQQSQIKNSIEDTPIINDNSPVDEVVNDSVLVDAPIGEANNTQDNNIVENMDNANGNSTNIQQQSSQTLEEKAELITDEQAKTAIQLVEEAQRTIEENVKLIKLYISQEKKLKGEDNLSAEEMSVAPKNSEIIVETPVIVSETSAIPKEFDVVNNIELAPQPNEKRDTLSDEAELKDDYGVDISTNMNTSINMLNSFDTSVTIPTDNGTNEINVSDRIVENPLVNSNLNQEKTIISQPESEVEIIDTVSMIPNRNSVEQNNNAQPHYIDTGLPTGQTTDTIQQSGTQNNMNTEVSVMDTTPIAPVIDTSVVFPQANVSVEPYNYISNQPVQENMVSIPQNEVKIDTQIVENNSQATVNLNESPSISEENNKNLEANPVIIPNGQSSDIDQGLVLTPEAFKIAA